MVKKILFWLVLFFFLPYFGQSLYFSCNFFLKDTYLTSNDDIFECNKLNNQNIYLWSWNDIVYIKEFSKDKISGWKGIDTIFLKKSFKEYKILWNCKKVCVIKNKKDNSEIKLKNIEKLVFSDKEIDYIKVLKFYWNTDLNICIPFSNKFMFDKLYSKWNIKFSDNCKNKCFFPFNSSKYGIYYDCSLKESKVVNDYCSILKKKIVFRNCSNHIYDIDSYLCNWLNFLKIIDPRFSDLDIDIYDWMNFITKNTEKKYLAIFDKYPNNIKFYNRYCTNKSFLPKWKCKLYWLTKDIVWKKWDKFDVILTKINTLYKDSLWVFYYNSKWEPAYGEIIIQNVQDEKNINKYLYKFDNKSIWLFVVKNGNYKKWTKIQFKKLKVQDVDGYVIDEWNNNWKQVFFTDVSFNIDNQVHFKDIIKQNKHYLYVKDSFYSKKYWYKINDIILELIPTEKVNMKTVYKICSSYVKWGPNGNLNGFMWFDCDSLAKEYDYLSCKNNHLRKTKSCQLSFNKKYAKPSDKVKLSWNLSFDLVKWVLQDKVENKTINLDEETFLKKRYKIYQIPDLKTLEKKHIKELSYKLFTYTNSWDIVSCDTLWSIKIVYPNDAPVCGNWIKEKWEECDLGDLNGWKECTKDCKLAIPTCGSANKVYSADETSYGNDTFCKNGVLIWFKPLFPDKWKSVSWTCYLNWFTQKCVAMRNDDNPICWNGVVEWSEECDDGNKDSWDGCSSTCKKEIQIEW